MKSFFKKVLSTSSDHFWMPGHINHCNVISMWDDFFWAVSMSVRSIRSFAVQRSSVSAQTPTCGTTDALQQAQGGSVTQGPVSNDVYFQLLLRENPNSPRFFQKDTTLCRCRIIYPSNDFFFLYHFLFNHWFCTWRLEIFCSFLSHPAIQQDALDGYPRFRIVQSLPASCMIYAGYFCQRYSNADQAAGCNCSVYPWRRHKQK